MRVKIIRRTFGGVEFGPEVRVLHLGGQTSANVEKLEFELPEEWAGCAVTLHIQRQDGTLPTPILLDESGSCAVGKEFTASPCGSWMLLALGEDGYRALTRPAKYDCYETLATDGEAEISPTQYELFVARVLAYANSAQESAKEARNAAAQAKENAEEARRAKKETAQAADTMKDAAESAKADADRAAAAAKRAEGYAPEDGEVRSVNGKGGIVVLDADDVGAVPENSDGYVAGISLTGRTLTITFGDGSSRTMQTMDTTALENMTGILGTEHGGTGQQTPLTAEDVGAVEKNSGNYVKSVVLQNEMLVLTDGSGKVVRYGYTLKAATADTLGGIKVGKNLSITNDGTLSGEDPYQLTDSEIKAALGYVPMKSIFDITYCGVYKGAGRSGSATSPGVQLQLPTPCDAIVIAKSTSAIEPPDMNFIKILNIASSEFFIPVDQLTSDWQSAESLQSQGIIMNKQNGGTDLYLRVVDNTLQMYVTNSAGYEYIANLSSKYYHYYGLKLNA